MAATLFISSPMGARLDKKNRVLHLSPIFRWYERDFEKTSGNIVDFVKRYLGEEDRKFIEDNLAEIKIDYQEYDWGLNIRS